jgi:CelD/BcsL family acetyltransferase involved in cellulose biosynthesis
MNQAVITPAAAAAARPAADAASDAGFTVSSWRTWATPAATAKWDQLSRASASPNPFFESWFLGPALEQFDPAGRILLARLENAGDLTGLLPLARQPRYGTHPLPHLASWLHANCFLGAPLVAPGHEQDFWRHVLEWADRNAGTALFLHLAAIPLDSSLATALEAVCREDGRRVALVHREDRALLEGPADPEAYLATALPAKKRKELRRQHARLSEQGTLTIAHQRDAQGIDDWIERFLKLEAAGWKGRAGSALGSAPATAQLFRHALTEAARRGALDRLSLSLDGNPLAMLATFIAAPGAFSFKTAYDERYARYSPGVLLQLQNLSLLTDPAIAWCDSCAAADHPMIDSLWTGRRAMGRFSVAIGGRVRRAIFDRLVSFELARNPTGIA